MRPSEELRKASGALDYIASLLDTNDSWKIVMAYIPKDLNNDNYLYSDQYVRKYNNEHVRLIEEYAQTERISCAKVLFDEWGSSGRVRPTLQTLMVMLTKANMFRAADHLANTLNLPSPPRPSDGPGARVNVSEYLNNLSLDNPTETRMLQNGATNETDDAVFNGPTQRMGPSAPYMHSPSTEKGLSNSVPIPVFMNGQETVMIVNNNSFEHRPAAVSDMMKFSRDQSSHVSSSQYMPHFSQLHKPETSRQDHSSLGISDSEISESSQSNSNVTSHSESSQASINHVPMHLVQTNLAMHRLYEQVDRDIIQDQRLIAFQYTELYAITANFRDKAGSGGFGDIFKGYHKEHGLLAVKRSHGMHIMQADLIMKIFNTEVISLSVLRHENIVHIVGYSLDGPSPCIICEYIEGGSLLEYMKNRENRRNLNTTHRMSIMIGTAKGLKHIHSTEKPASTVSGTQDMNTSRKQYFVHGDVKSANILITKDFVPKICDLGLSKQVAATFHTESIMGTRAYMSHERLSGTITPKGDTYSYGIVLLELLTGLPPDNIIGSDGNYDIKTYVDEKCRDGNISSLVDQDVGEWSTAQRIYNLAKQCTKHDRFERPSMIEICDILHAINSVGNLSGEVPKDYMP